MKLYVKERIALLNLLPQQAGFADMVIIKSMREEIDFSEKEANEFKFKDKVQKGKTILTWDTQKEKTINFNLNKKRNSILAKAIVNHVKGNLSFPEGLTIELIDEIKFTKEQKNQLKAAVKQMDKKEKITLSNFSICEKFLPQESDHKQAE